jgi:hypothetical protein
MGSARARRGKLAALALGLLAAAAGCAGPFRCPAAGGPVWRELSSEHFTLATDLPSEEARGAVQDLEDFRATLIATAWPRLETPRGRLRVVIVDRERDWRAFEDARDGFYTDALFQPFIALRAGGSDHTRVRIRHELTHHLSRFYVRTQPDWLAEGLATFFETLVHDRESGEILVGLPQPAHLNLLAQQGKLRIAETLAGTLKNEEQGVFYATSWLMVHYFISRHREAFTRFMRALDGGTDPALAFRQSFGDLSPDVLAAELRGYGRIGHSLVASGRFRPPDPVVQERVLPDADVHALRALLAVRALAGEASPAARDRARAEIAEALRQDPHNVLALAVRTFALEETVDREVARAATQAAPDSWLAWLVRYRAEGGTLATVEGRRAALATVRLAAANPSIKLPFGPEGSRLFEGPDPPLRACPAPPPTPVRWPRPRGSRGLEPCPAGPPLSPEDALAELRAIVTSDVSWCFFDRATWKPVTVAIDIDGQGRPAAICLEAPARDEPAHGPLTSCVTRALARLTFPALPSCPRQRLFQLAPAPDGHVQVFGSAR